MTEEPDTLGARLHLLSTALERQNKLVDEVAAMQVSNETLKSSNNTLKVIVGLLLVVVVGVGGLATWARQAASDANQAAEDVQALLVQQEADRAQVSLLACRVRNGGNASTRDQFFNLYDTLGEFLTTEEATAIINELRASVPLPEDQDRDCDGDGSLNPADYPEDA